MVVEAFGPSVHQFIETVIEEIRVLVVEPLNLPSASVPKWRADNASQQSGAVENHLDIHYEILTIRRKHLAIRHFRTDAEVQEAEVKWLSDLDPDFFYAGFDKLVHRCRKCFDNHGDYEEK
ncbi:hypothetical protein AVEN_180445-1 [Araneus ventricosus]|uniref:Uncharacterized protein n=1 Tax=Araneus ventricosus TaxID=182803 RepID=A0A4Y2GNV9_ARAVE|nr:hypothetical protein AVEN_180445-1 [Araneus ventricosus]